MSVQTGRRPQDSMQPEPFTLVADCPRCGVRALHMLGTVRRFRQDERVIVRDCVDCAGRWTEQLDGGSS
jgi:DNA-directed RNA polymerase subunit M/transcription elongation factor TFIIS